MHLHFIFSASNLHSAICWSSGWRVPADSRTTKTHKIQYHRTNWKQTAAGTWSSELDDSREAVHHPRRFDLWCHMLMLTGFSVNSLKRGSTLWSVSVTRWWLWCYHVKHLHVSENEEPHFSVHCMLTGGRYKWKIINWVFQIKQIHK